MPTAKRTSIRLPCDVALSFAFLKLAERDLTELDGSAQIVINAREAGPKGRIGSIVISLPGLDEVITITVK